MPTRQSARRAARAAQRRAERNRPIRSSARTHVTKARKLIESNDLDNAQEAVRRANQVLDEAAQKGVIHPNNAARRKSRLTKSLNKARAAAAQQPEEPQQA
ncbi:MAG: 30S ribosomal protein S20 [Chloroflexota bacterium]